MAERTRAQKPEDSTPYQVVARRFRPKDFAEVVGQEAILQSLQLALEQQRIPHAFLFSGSRGVGKTTMARILARCLNCENGPTAQPCGKCELCRSILDGSNTDVVEIDAASNNGVDDVRAMRDHVGFAAMQSRYRVFILDEAHMLSKPAFNALLKTLEEPPPNVVFVLATTELHKVPETIRSRCQVLLFRRLADQDITKRLAMIAASDGVELPQEVLDDIAASSRGGMRDSETLLERVLPLAKELGAAFDLAAYRQMVQRLGADRAVEVVGSLLAGDGRAALQFAREVQLSGVDEREVLGELVEQLRWLLLLRVDGAESALVPASGDLRQQLVGLAANVEPSRLDAMISAGLLGRDRIRRSDDRGVVLELSLLRMAQAGALPTLADLLATVTSGQVMAAPSQAPGRPAPPRPAAAAGVPAPNVAVPAPVADLRARLLAKLQAERPMLMATLEQCRLDGPDAAGKVVITLLSEAKMHRDRLASPDLQKQLTAMVKQLAPNAVNVEFSGGAAAAAKAVPADTTGGERTQRVLGRFGGRIVAVDPEDRLGGAQTEAPGEAADQPADQPEVPPADDPDR